MKSQELKAALVAKNVSQSEIGRKLNKDQSVVSRVVMGHARSAEIEEEISLRLGIPLEDIWPQHYGGEKNAAEPVLNYRLGRFKALNPEEELITLWRKMAWDEQVEAMGHMRRLAAQAPPDAKPGHEGIAGQRHVLKEYAERLADQNPPNATNVVTVSRNQGQMNTGSVVNNGKK